MSELSDYIAGLTTLVGYWPLDDTSGTTAVEAGGALGDATYSGTVTIDQEGPAFDASKSVLLDGTTGLITLPSDSINTQVNGSDDVVISVFFKLPADWSWSTNQGLFWAFGNTGGGNVTMLAMYFSAANVISVGARSDIGEAFQSLASTTRTFAKNTWYNALVHFDCSADKIYLYINGVLDKESSTATFNNATFVKVAASTTGEGFGGYLNGVTPTNPFYGYLSHAFVLKAASSVATIAADVWEKANRCMFNPPVRFPKKGYYSIHHLNK